MKQRLLLYCICATLLFSCKKEEKATKDTKLYPINFNLSGFTETQIPIGIGKEKTASLATQTTDTVPVQSLIYMLFDSYGTLVSQKRMEKGAADFGTVKDNVQAGNYTAAFIGGSSALNIYYNNNFGYGNFWDDSFYKKVPIKVTTSGINQAVILDRITAELNIVLKDPIPTGTTKITVALPDTVQVNGLSGKVALINTNSTTKTINAEDIGKTNYTITIYTLNNIKPFDVTINYYGVNPTGPLGSKIVRNVICKRNTRTTLSGNLFVPGNSEFTITLNQNWDTDNVGF